MLLVPPSKSPLDETELPPLCSSDAPQTVRSFSPQTQTHAVVFEKRLSYKGGAAKEKPPLNATVRPHQRQGQCHSGSQRQGTSPVPTVPGHVTFPQEEDPDRLSALAVEGASSSTGHLSRITQGAPHDVFGSLFSINASKIVEISAAQLLYEWHRRHVSVFALQHLLSCKRSGRPNKVGCKHRANEAENCLKMRPAMLLLL